MNPESLLIYLQFIGNINYIKKLVRQTYVDYSPHVPYKKSHFLNRTVISGANGPITLSVPIKKGRDQKTRFGEVIVAYEENWRKDHWKAIISSYNKSPWFEHYHDSMSDFYKRDFEHLIDWNIESLNIIKTILGISTIINVAPEMTEIDRPLNRKSHVAESNNSETGTQPFPLETHHGTEDSSSKILKPYPQVFSDRFGFISNLSILDLIFCIGPREALAYLTST